MKNEVWAAMLQEKLSALSILCIETDNFFLAYHFKISSRNLLSKVRKIKCEYLN
jgi:hypothetical protein